MKLDNILLVALAFTLSVSCKKDAGTENKQESPHTKNYANLEKANWFIGEWANKSAEGDLTERWKKENDSLYLGESYFVTNGKDTVFTEHVRLEESNGILAFTVTVPGQNKEKPVRFEMTSVNDDRIVFENPKHDFPNKIIYYRVGNDSLKAEVSGIQKGKPSVQKFAMKKQ